MTSPNHKEKLESGAEKQSIELQEFFGTCSAVVLADRPVQLDPVHHPFLRVGHVLSVETHDPLGPVPVTPAGEQNRLFG